MITAFCFLHELLRTVDTLVGWSWDKHVMPVPIYENIKYLFSLIETSDSIHTTPSAWENYTHGNFNQSSRLCLRIRSLVCQLYSLYPSCIFLQHIARYKMTYPEEREQMNEAKGKHRPLAQPRNNTAMLLLLLVAQWLWYHCVF